MDRGGLDICILSLTAPGVQGIPKVTEAIAQARRTNDYLAENIAKKTKRLKGFATLPLQDPEAAAQELTRCVKDWGFCGASIRSLYSRICSLSDSSAISNGPSARRSSGLKLSAFSGFILRTLHPRSRSP
jgi:hypothetical protein